MKKFVSLLLAVMLVIPVLCTPPIFAETAQFEASQTFEPIEDAAYDYNDGVRSYVDNTLLRSTRTNLYKDENSIKRTAFMKFALNDIRSNIALGCEVEKAVVQVKPYTSDSKNDMELELYKYHDDWSEVISDGTPVNPAIPLTATSEDEMKALRVSKNPETPELSYVMVLKGVTKNTAAADRPVYTLDITEYLISELKKENDNHLSVEMGYRFNGTSASVAMYSRTSNNDEDHPKLVVTYREPIKKEVKFNPPTLKKGAEKKIGQLDIAVLSSGVTYVTSSDETGIKDALISTLSSGEQNMSVEIRTETGSETGNVCLYCVGHKTYYSSLNIKFNDGSEDVELQPVHAGAVDHKTSTSTTNENNRYWLGLYSSGGQRAKIYQKYDLSTLAGKEEKISSVQFSTVSYSNTGDKYIFGLYQVDNNWDNSTLCYNNRPTVYCDVPVDAIEAGKVKITSSFTNNLEAAASFTAICAIYKGSELIGVSAEEVSELGVGDTKEVSKVFTVPALSDGESYSGKIMAVEDMTSLKPVNISLSFN